MTPEEYAARQTIISAAAAAAALKFGRFFSGPGLSFDNWLMVLEMLFPSVKSARTESASLARDFYDSERSVHLPLLPKNKVDLIGSDFARFAESMEPARRRMQLANTPEHAVAQFTGQAVREVENAGRRQIIKAVNEDYDLAEVLDMFRNPKRELEPPKLIEPDKPLVSQMKDILDNEPSKETVVDFLRKKEQAEALRGNGTPVQGWARVATGRETCAFCLMMISRGPVYKGADKAGLDLEDQEVTDLWNKLDYDSFLRETKPFMDQWHPNCDCKVVPVFKVENWPGMSAQKQAEQAWITAAKEATRLIESGDARSDNHNKEALNALRRRIERGDLRMSDYAAFAA